MTRPLWKVGPTPCPVKSRDHAVPEAVGVGLDDAPDHIQRAAGLDRFDGPHRGLVRALDEQARLLGHITGEESRIGIAVHTVDVGR